MTKDGAWKTGSMDACFEDCLRRIGDGVKCNNRNCINKSELKKDKKNLIVDNGKEKEYLKT